MMITTPGRRVSQFSALNTGRRCARPYAGAHVAAAQSAPKFSPLCQLSSVKNRLGFK
jgi:hypothetical protein